MSASRCSPNRRPLRSRAGARGGRGPSAGSAVRGPGRCRRSWAASQAVPAEPMKVALGDMDQPDLRIGETLAQPTDGLHLVLVELVLARFDVDGDELVRVGRRESRADLALDERVAPAGELVFAVPPFGRSHDVLPIGPGGRAGRPLPIVPVASFGHIPTPLRRAERPNSAAAGTGATG